MAETFKDKVTNAAQSAADATKAVGQKIADGAEKAAEFVKEKTGVGCTKENVGVSGIKEHMDVFGSCGTKVGVVDRVEGSAIKLTKASSPDDQHHFIPTGWVDHVDNHVHLKMNSKDAERDWKTDAASFASGG